MFPVHRGTKQIIQSVGRGEKICFFLVLDRVHPVSTRFFPGHLKIFTLEDVVVHSQAHKSLNCSHD